MRNTSTHGSSQTVRMGSFGKRRVERPGPGTPLRSHWPRAELETRSGDQILDGARDEHLSTAGLGRDRAPTLPRGLPACPRAARTRRCGRRSGLESERLDPRHDRLAAADRPRGTVERCEEAVSGGVALLAAEPPELSPHDRVVAGEQVAPGTVAELAARSVEPTMSVNITVASTLSGTSRALAGDELQLVDDLRRRSISS